MKQSAFIAALKFVAHAKAKNDVRYYLNTVQFEVSAGVLTLIATDGHRLAWAEVAAHSDGPVAGLPDGQWLIDGAGVDSILKAFKANSTGTLALSFGDMCLLVEGGGGIAAAMYCDGKFPDWRRVTQQTEGEPDPAKHINCDYLADAGKAFGPLLGKYGRTVVKVGPQHSCMRLEAVPSVAGVKSAQCIIMPMRPE